MPAFRQRLQPIRFGAGELVHPIDARARAQETFMKKCCELEPELMRSFYRDVYLSEVGIDIWMHLGQPRVDLRPFSRVLNRVIADWLTRWHLGQRGNAPRWLFDGAACMILEYESRGISPLELMPTDEDLGWSEVLDYYHPGTDPPFEIPSPIEFEEFEWDPLIETRRDAYNRILKGVKEQLQRQLDELENEAGEIYWKPIVKDSIRHYTWLARHLIKKERIQQIAETPGPIARNRGGTPMDDNPVDDRAVAKAIKPIARLLELSLPDLSAE